MWRHWGRHFAGSVALGWVDLGVAKRMSGNVHFCTSAWETDFMLVGISGIENRLPKRSKIMCHGLKDNLLVNSDTSVVPFRTRDIVYLCRFRWFI